MDQDAIIGLVEQLVATIFSKVRTCVLSATIFTAPRHTYSAKCALDPFWLHCWLAPRCLPRVMIPDTSASFCLGAEVAS